MSDLKFVSWKEIFQKAVEETDREKQGQLVPAADISSIITAKNCIVIVIFAEELSA